VSVDVKLLIHANGSFNAVIVRLRAKESELSASEKKLLSAESQVNELQARLNDAVNQRRHFEDEYNVCFICLFAKHVCFPPGFLRP